MGLIGLKIAFVVPWIEVGGVETYVFRLGTALRRRGHAVDVVSAGAEGKWWDRVAEHGLGYWCFREAESPSLVSHAVKVCRFLRSRQYDVVLLNHCLQVAPALSMLPDSMTVISVVHNDSEGVYEVACANWKAWDAAVGVSPRVTAEMRRRIPERDIKTICHGVELPDPQQWLGRVPAAGEFRMLFVGRVAHDQKGVLFLPDILAGVQSQGIAARLTIIGDGPDREELNRRLLEHCKPGSFDLIARQPNDEVYRRMLNHHVLLMPSLFEGLGIVLLEAQACGCVPIASCLAGVTDVVIAHGKTGFLCPVSDVQGFVEAAVRLARDAELWKRLSVVAHNHIAEKFTTDSMASQYLDLFREAQRGAFRNQTPRSRQPKIDFSVYGWKGFLPPCVRRFARAVRALNHS